MDESEYADGALRIVERYIYNFCGIKGVDYSFLDMIHDMSHDMKCTNDLFLIENEDINELRSPKLLADYDHFINRFAAHNCRLIKAIIFDLNENRDCRYDATFLSLKILLRSIMREFDCVRRKPTIDKSNANDQDSTGKFLLDTFRMEIFQKYKKSLQGDDISTGKWLDGTGIVVSERFGTWIDDEYEKSLARDNNKS